MGNPTYFRITLPGNSTDTPLNQWGDYRLLQWFHFLCHCRGPNIRYFTKQGWFYNFLALKWCLRFQISLGMFVRLFWPQNGPRYRSCHLRGQKSLVSLENSRVCAQGPFTVESLKWPYLVIFNGWFHNVPPHLQHRYINSLKIAFPLVVKLYYNLCLSVCW